MIQLTDTKKIEARETQLKDAGISDDTAYWIAVGLEVAKLAVTAGLTLYLTYKIQDVLKSLLDPMNEASAAAVVTKKALAKRLQRPEIEDMEFDSYEMGLLNEILGPGEIKETFQDIGGMEAQLEEVKDNIVLPMQLWTRFRKIGVLSAEEEELSTCPTGMLLYGQPGTGKSLTAKAVAKESGATFMNIKASSILSKYIGESDKMVSAIFRLGRKLAPTVIFIDEIDTVLRKRSSFDNSGGAVQSMQGVFLAEWDGLNQNNAAPAIKDAEPSAAIALRESAPPKVEDKRAAPVVVLGATNRPTDLDEAFMRRMPVQVQTLMPGVTARAAILRAQLRLENLADDVDLSELAVATDNFSGSDIRELVRLAKQHRAKKLVMSVKESQAMVTDSAPAAAAGEVSAEGGAGTGAGASESAVGTAGGGAAAVRALTKESFEHALQKVKSSAAKTSKFGNKQVAKEVMDRFAKYQTEETA